MFDRRRQRIDRILAALEANQSLHIQDVAQMLEVSVMTLRRDLAECDHELLNLGGYLIKLAARHASLYSLDSEKGIRLKNKRWVGRLAAEQIEAGDSIFIDCGTTTPHIVAALPKDIECTVICYSQNIASLVRTFPRVTLVLLGGMFYPDSATYFCDEGLAFLKRFGINKAFLSAGGISLERGLSCSNLHEVKVKQAVMDIAIKTILVADSAKFGQIRPAFFSEFSRLTMVITDSGIGDSFVNEILNSPVELLIKSRAGHAQQASGE